MRGSGDQGPLGRPARVVTGRLRRTLPTVPVLALLALVACASPGPAPPEATAPTIAATRSARSAVERLLERSGIESIVANRAGEFTRRVAIMTGALTDEDLERLVPAVRSGFAPERLRQDVAAFIAGDAPDGAVEQVLRWSEGGATAELERISDAYEPQLTMEEYARSLRTSPRPEERVRLVAEWAEVQGAGEFYLLMGEAISKAAHAVRAAFRTEAPDHTPLGGDDLRSAMEMSANAAVVTFLYRLETVPADVLRAAIEEYAGEAGQWYVRAYALAVAEAMRAAGRRVVAELGRTRGQAGEGRAQ